MTDCESIKIGSVERSWVHRAEKLEEVDSRGAIPPDAAASSHETESGTFQTRVACALTYSANEPSSDLRPPCTNPATRSPSFTFETSGPTSETVPAKSHPRMEPGGETASRCCTREVNACRRHQTRESDVLSSQSG